MAETKKIRIDLIDPNPNQPRKFFEQQPLEELAASIKADGLYQPITVRPVGKRYQIICGERRWRASKLAGLKTIECLVKNLTDAQVLVAAIVENLHRKDVNPIEESDAYTALLKEVDNDEEKLVLMLGKTTRYVRDRLRLQSLNAEMREAVIKGIMTLPHAIHICKLDSEEQMIAFRRIGSMNSKEWGRMVEQLAAMKTEPTMFDLGRPDPEHKRVAKKYDDLLEKVSELLRKSFDKTEIEVLASVLDENTERRAELLEAILKNLYILSDSYRKARAKRQGISTMKGAA